MKCDQCEQLRINGVVCHEIGCPNMGRTWDEDREQWIKYRACFECGCDVEVGESCDCQDDFEEVWECEDDECFEDIYNEEATR